MIALVMFQWVQDPYAMGITGLKTAELKSGGFGSCYGDPRATGEENC